MHGHIQTRRAGKDAELRGGEAVALQHRFSADGSLATDNCVRPSLLWVPQEKGGDTCVHGRGKTCVQLLLYEGGGGSSILFRCAVAFSGVAMAAGKVGERER